MLILTPSVEDIHVSGNTAPVWASSRLLVPAVYFLKTDLALGDGVGSRASLVAFFLCRESN